MLFDVPRAPELCRAGDDERLQRLPFPQATRPSERTISIPLPQSLSDRDVDDVIEAVQQVLTHFAR
jgi:dTDP-4-amino-4,6-dideoxygalactose transaminase